LLRAEDLKTLVYAGRAKATLERLEKLRRDTPKNGPGTKGRRMAKPSAASSTADECSTPRLTKCAG
jgi:hypothetical protein